MTLPYDTTNGTSPGDLDNNPSMAPDPAPESLAAEGAGTIIPAFDFRVDYAAVTVMGQGRETNQDSLRCVPELGLFIIADGMGGHAAGEVASKLAIDEVEKALGEEATRQLVRDYAREPDLEGRRLIYRCMEEAARRANAAVIAAGQENHERHGMGTTLDFVLLVRDRAFFAHVGDSRAYLVRPTITLQLTHDHAAYDSLRTSGKRMPQRMVRSPLSNSIGHRKTLKVDTLFVDLATRDRIILCTDGVFDVYDEERLLGQSMRKGPVAEVSRRLARLARKRGPNDDTTAITIAVKRRFAKRPADAGPRAQDIQTLASSPLLDGLETAFVLSTLTAGVEVDLQKGDEIPRAVANDRVAYVVIDGMVELPNGRTLGPSGLLMAESLLDIARRGPLPKVTEDARLLRIRQTDFEEVCTHNTALAAELYKRIARHLASLQG